MFTKNYRIYTPRLKSTENGRPVAYNKKLGDLTYNYNNYLLESFGMHSLSFCFFIYWDETKLNGTFNPNIWIKKEISIPGPYKIDLNDETFQHYFFLSEPPASILSKDRFFEHYRLNWDYMLIKDLHHNWDLNASTKVAIQVHYDPATVTLSKKPLSLSQLEDLLISNSNGKFVMNKTLSYSETDLEYYLAMHSPDTGALFPGDCDMLLYDASYNCRAILEFKKCTRFGNIPIEEQCFQNYRHDKNKYVRLNILRNYFSEIDNHQIPLITIFYPTTNENKIKLECITDELQSGPTLIYNIADNEFNNQKLLLEKIFSLIDTWEGNA